MNGLKIIFVLSALSACASKVPNDIGAIDNGFGEAIANGQTAMTAQDQVSAILGNDVGASPIDSPQAPIAQSIENMPMQTNPEGSISNSNDFQAISQRYSIESDAERLAQLREQYQVVSPTDLPQRRAQNYSIVEYALVHQFERGVKHYRRSPFATTRRSELNCASYASADKAQQAFLNGGGPEKDRLNLDPDGDGYACDWDPTPYRIAITQ